ncbi:MULTISPECIES: outer membrane beta-barrel protein [unclassified Uliginosibacterium]|jgi:hypothetical protein|uniref:outer membrane beta-barrel protein n=1 Tax=unclassified Uliginosibacterium TaxID=2621521 RepID=UPI000C7D954A|nr:MULTISPECIES: outer membrane beta-barrel protein [unclassified Uliginosibacterium]MDO6387185.1 outer membrane beta-barrel protein [Uliginosibacterium sp. 31-12]PLK50798.1 hypothetical protein C0V76_03035 [Uliginosibacterium sp. TH139]
MKRVVVCLLAAMASLAVSAEELGERNALTVYGGYRVGGSFTEVDTGNSLKLQNSPAVSLAVDVGLDPQRQLQVFLSRQSSHVDFSQVAAPKTNTLGTTRLPFTATYLHLGGTYFFDGPIGQGPYAVGGLGVAVLQLDGPGYGEEVLPSMNLGFGYQWLFARNLALRLEGRYYASLIDSSGSLFCSGGCVVSISGQSLGQGELLLGLSVPF